jgi:HprK-related kinase A
VNLSAYTKQQLIHRLGDDGLYISTGPFTIHLQSSLADIQDHLHDFYSHYRIAENCEFADFHIRIDYPANLRRWLKPQVYFYLDGRVPFKPLPAGQAGPMLEWGMNWCIANHAHQYLIVHAAALEKEGQGILLPAAPGSGKSTLAAALMFHGWRLLSDELGIIDLRDGSLVPLARPVNLKNESIGLIREFSQAAVISRAYEDTNKGTVALVAAPVESIAKFKEAVKPRWIIQPQYQPQAPAALSKISKARMFMHVAEHSFNYSLLGSRGFDMLANVIDTCETRRFTYSRLDDAISIFANLSDPLNG